MGTITIIQPKNTPSGASKTYGATFSRQSYTPQPSQTEIVEKTEVGEALVQLNKDSVETSSRMSDIDMRTRLDSGEVPSILAVDALVTMRFLPSECLQLTRQKKRLAVSIGGQGRQEIVDIVGRNRDERKESTGGVTGWIASKFSGKDKNE